MPTILPIDKDVIKKARKYGLEKKLVKQCKLLIANPNHPSLHLELLEPKTRGIYSFRLGRKFRALCLYDSHKQVVEILTITVHYK